MNELMKRTVQTPWGVADYQTEVAPGIMRVETSSHGGIFLDGERNAKIPAYMRRGNAVDGGWYEEDCEACIPACVFRDEFYEDYKRRVAGVSSENTPQSFDQIVDGEIRTLRQWFPDEYEKFTGRTIEPGESTVRDERLFYERYKGHWVTVSAVGDWHKGVPKGQVGVIAKKLGQEVTSGEKWFLLPLQTYRTRGNHGYVIGSNPEFEFEVVKGDWGTYLVTG